jgi:transcriptional regulator with PAS, ATPase and Fis domain
VLMGDLPAKPGAGLDFPIEDSIAEWVWRHQEPLTIATEAETRLPDFARALLQGGIKSFCGVPLMIASRRIGVLGLASAKPGAFDHFKFDYVQRGSPDGTGLSPNLRAAQGPHGNCGTREGEPKYLVEQVRPEDRFEDIVGRSAAIRALLEQVQIVAPTDATVLILGETGTGKELLANFLYRNGPRSSKSFIAINCAAIQNTMLESELFGYEAGAFTGAERRKIGLMEIADGGVLFLDEISSMPLDIQAKLLRALEERAFRRVGGTNLIHIDVQIVAASNRNLTTMMKDGLFREDLYYRLKVVDLHLPPLRERKSDIPELVGFMIRQNNARMGMNVTNVTPRAMEALIAYNWPGNIRELGNSIERAILFCDNEPIDLPHLPLEIAQIKQP